MSSKFLDALENNYKRNDKTVFQNTIFKNSSFGRDSLAKNSKTLKYLKTGSQKLKTVVMHLHNHDLISIDKTYRELLFKLVEILKTYKTTDSLISKEHGLINYAFSSDTLDSFYSVAGIQMTPSHVPPKDNYHLRDELGLQVRCKEFVPEFESFLEDLFQGFSNKTIYSDVKYTKYSSPGFPFMIDDKDWNNFPLNSTHVVKLQSAHLYSKNKAEILELLNNLDFKKLYLNHNISAVARLNYRLQVDGFKNGKPKPRKVFTGEKWVVADKKQIFDDLHIRVSEPYSAMRKRTIVGFPATLNSILSVYDTQLREWLVDSYETFQFNGPGPLEKELNDKINLKEYTFLSLDVSNFDMTVPVELRLALNRFYQKVYEGYGALSGFGNFGFPVYRRDEDNEIYLYGDPYNVEDYRFGSLSSGIQDVTTQGKIYNVFAIWSALKSYIPDLKEWLNHRNKKILLYNFGDDNVLIIRRDIYSDVKRKLLNSKIFKFGEEVPSYLGFKLFIRNGKLYVSYNPIRLWRNFLIPERSITSPLRRGYALGWVARLELASRYPLVKEMHEIIKDLFATFYKEDVDNSMYRQARYFMEANLAKYIDVKNLSEEELEVLIDPSKLQWKYDESKIRDEVIQNSISYLDNDIVKRILNS